MITAVTWLFFTVVALHLFSTRRRWILNPVPVFVAVQGVMFIGSLPLLEPDRQADQVHALVMLSALLFFILGAEAAHRLWPVKSYVAWRSQSTQVEASEVFSFVLWSLIGVSLAATIAFYVAAGANIFVQSVISLLSSGQRLEGAVEIRESFYAGDRYFAAGYVGQFKNLLLPLLTAYLTLRYVLTRRQRDLAATAILIPASLAGILGTGQRGAFVAFVLMALTFGFAALSQRAGRRFAIVLGGMGLMLFAAATFFLGRGVLASGAVRQDNLSGVLIEVWQRAFWGNQASSVAGFRYVFDHSIGWGLDWARSFTALLPRNIFPDKPVPELSADVFAMLYGSRAGTAPASMWGSVWFSFGPFGIPVVAAALGVLFHRVHFQALSGPKVLGRLGVWSAISILLGTWAAGGPETLLNQGILTLIVLSFALRLRGSRAIVINRGSRESPTMTPVHENA